MKPVTTNPDLFTPIQLGSYTLPNRIIMAPLTRMRAGSGNIPTEMNATYYAQRASAGLIIAEATQVSPQGRGYTRSPGIHSPEQVVGWRLVTDAVHTAGGRIFLQLWHAGRTSHPALQENSALPVAQERDRYRRACLHARRSPANGNATSAGNRRDSGSCRAVSPSGKKCPCCRI